MRKIIVLAAALLTACASGPDVKPTAEELARVRIDGERGVAAKLRSIRARVRKGEGSKVREELLAEIQKNPKDVQLKVLHAWAGAPSEDAWQEVNKIARLAPDEVWATVVSGQIYLQWKGFADHADGEFQKALQLRPGFVAAQVGRADVLRMKGKFAEARAAYEAILKVAPDWQEALSGLGLSQFALEDAAAKATLKRAVELDGSDFDVLSALASSARREGDADAAIEYGGRMLEFSPGDRAARIALASMREKKGDLAGAAADYEKAMAISADSALVRALANTYKALNRPDDEIRLLQRLAQLEVSDPAPMMRIAELRKADNDLEGAETALREASDRVPENAQLHLAVARFMREREDLVAAIEEYRIAKAKGAMEATAELKEVEAKAFVPEKPVAGDPNRVYSVVSGLLNKQFKERVKEGKAVGGKLRVRVTINDQGQAVKIDTLEDTVHDGVLGALVYFALKDAQYPRKNRTPVFEFVLVSGK